MKGMTLLHIKYNSFMMLLVCFSFLCQVMTVSSQPYAHLLARSVTKGVLKVKEEEVELRAGEARGFERTRRWIERGDGAWRSEGRQK